ncbi:MAG: wax ester/triacylglycerol synthase family O-acyltransferase [Acidobacteria bacterium]|nr:wax ester/triacylglycerol synthase family O-acyltransferase [Acidobacteriota bacterium]
MRQLSGLDAGFLTLETPTAPMLIGGLALLDPQTPQGRLDVEAFRALIRRRLHRAVAFRRVLASLPLDLTRPYWVELPPEEVDLEVHIERTELPEPGGWHELSELMAWELSQPLNRQRPLWQMVFVEGLNSVQGAPEGAVAVLTKVHHAAIDGVSGAEILSALFDGLGPEDPVPAVAESPAEPPSHPSDAGTLELLAQAGRDLASIPLAAPRILGRSLLGMAGSALSRLRPGESPPLLFTAPRTPLNRSLGAERSWFPAFLDLERVKAVKSSQGATVNDVVLAVCAAALRSWLLEGSSLPKEPLVAMVPVSVRSQDRQKDGGNLVSAMLVSLATDEADPQKRLQRIRDAARSSKAAHQAVGAQTLVQSADLLPFALSGLGVRLYSRMHLAERLRPLFNLVITNVPGPPRPLTVGGARLLAHVGAAPLFDGLGLILPVFSYAGRISIGVTADRKILPDAQGFARRLEEALEELEAAVGSLSSPET